MRSSFKRFVNKSDADEAAEAVARLYAQSIAKAYPMPPDVYGPGRQPEPREGYYQRWYVAPQAAVAADPDSGIPHALPDRIEPDAFCIAQDETEVTIGSGKKVRLNFKDLETR